MRIIVSNNESLMRRFFVAYFYYKP